MKFEVGDRVVCIDDSMWDKAIKKGNEYVISGITLCKHYVNLEGKGSLTFWPSRFELAKTTPVQGLATAGMIVNYSAIVPKVVRTESTVFVDCDDTLIMWNTELAAGKALVSVMNPHDGTYSHLVPHLGHIKVLKDRKARGSFIVVWSSGGFAWAEQVVKALGLQESVDLIMTKPHMYIDDKPCTAWMGEHLNLPFNSGYGDK